MFELAVSIFSVIVIAVSSWFLLYLAARFALFFLLRAQLGDMPSAEEVAELYDRSGGVNAWLLGLFFGDRNHSPTVTECPEGGQNALE